MTLKNYTAEGGTVGANVVQAATGSGDPLDITVVTNSSTLTFDNAQAAHGTKSIKVTPTATGSAIIYYNAASSSVATRMYVYLTVLPTADTYLLRYETGAGTTTSPRMLINATGKLRVQDAASAAVWTAASNFPLNQWVRVEMFCKPGTDTVTGTIKAAYYLGDSTTPIEAAYSNTAANAQTTAYSRISAGKTNASQTYATPFWVDDFAVDDAATGFIGKYVASNVAPSVNAGADQVNVEPWSTVTLTGSSSDSDGTVASNVWAQTAGTAVTLSGSGLTRTFTAPPTMEGDTLTFTLTATDNAGAVSTDTMTVGVLPATEFLRVAGAWVPCRLMTRSGGAWI